MEDKKDKTLSELSEEDISKVPDRITEEEMKETQRLVEEIKKKANIYGGR